MKKNRKLTKKDESEIDQLIEFGRFKWLTLKHLERMSPKGHKFFKAQAEKFLKGKLSMDELSNGYYMGEFVELIYGKEGYEYYNAKTGGDHQ